MEYNINQLMLNVNLTDEQKTQLNKNINNYYTIKCTVCGCTKITINERFDDIEFITITKSWGYSSTHDLETHKLVLCNHCYDKHILNGFLGQFITITNY